MSTETMHDRPADATVEPAETRGRSGRLFRWLIVGLLLVVVLPILFVIYRQQQTLSWIEAVEARGGWVGDRAIDGDWLGGLVDERRLRGSDAIWGVGLERATDGDLRRMKHYVNPAELTNLSLSDPQLTPKGVAIIGDFPELRHLTLRGDVFVLQNRELLERLGNLETLVIEDVSVSEQDLKMLDVIPNLNSLGLHDVELTDEQLRTLSERTWLKGLSISGTRFTKRSLQTLTGLTDLTSLELVDPDLTDSDLAPLASFRKLDFLRIHAPQVTDDGIKSLTTLKHLKLANLRYTDVTANGADQLQAALPDCEVIFDIFDLIDP